MIRRMIAVNDIPYEEHYVPDGDNQWEYKKELCVLKPAIDQMPVVDAVEVPCKIGDFVWAVRNFKGKKHPQRGIVSDMYFLKDMRLQIVVKYVARGEWGKTVFSTDTEAYAAIGERKENGN